MSMTGFFACSRGVSFANESITARLANALIDALPPGELATLRACAHTEFRSLQ